MLVSMQSIITIQADCVDVEFASLKVNQFYNQLCDAIHQCVKSCSGKVKRQPTVKSWWNANCKSARTRNRLFHYIYGRVQDSLFQVLFMTVIKIPIRHIANVAVLQSIQGQTRKQN